MTKRTLCLLLAVVVLALTLACIEPPLDDQDAPEDRVYLDADDGLRRAMRAAATATAEARR